MSTSLRSAGLVACVFAAVLATAPMSEAAVASPQDDEMTSDPMQPVVEPARDSSTPSPTTIPRRALAPPDDYDEKSIAAAQEADAAIGRSTTAEPVPIELPSVSVGQPTSSSQETWAWHEPAATGDAPILFDTAPGKTDVAGDSGARSGCSGNCYQTDTISHSAIPNDVYAFDYWYWMGLPQNNESNGCDSASAGQNCFWFASGMYFTDGYNAGMHIGPKRGNSAGGNAGSSWKMLMSGYNNGNYTGGQGTISLPSATWVRVRVWRVATYTLPGAPYTKSSTWQVYGMWGGNEQYMGSITIEGHWIDQSDQFMEIRESNDQCSTDFERVYFNDPRWLSSSQGWGAPQDGTGSYEANCPASDTALASISGDFVKDERETGIPREFSLW